MILAPRLLQRQHQASKSAVGQGVPQLLPGRLGPLQPGEEGKQAGPRPAHRHRQGLDRLAQQPQPRPHALLLRLHHRLQVVAQGRQGSLPMQSRQQRSLAQTLPPLFEVALAFEIEIAPQLTATAIGPGGGDTGGRVLDQQHRQLLGALGPQDALDLLRAVAPARGSPRGRSRAGCRRRG